MRSQERKGRKEQKVYERKLNNIINIVANDSTDGKSRHTMFYV